MGSPKAVTPTVASTGAAWTLLDPSAGTTANDAQLASNDSDSTYFDVTVNTGASGHGTFSDSGCDGFQNLQDVGDPDGYFGIELLMELTEVSAGNQSGTDEGLRMMVSGSHTVTTNVATMAGGFYVESTNDALRPADVGGRSGQWTKDNTDLDDTATGYTPCVYHSTLVFDATATPDVLGGLGRATGADNSDATSASSGGLTNLTGVCLVGIGLDIPAAAPTAGPRFKARVWWRWIDAVTEAPA